MVKLYEEFKCSIVAIQEVPSDQVNRYGIICGENIRDGVIRVNEMIEKPDIENAPSNLAIIGRYILTPDIFNIIRETKPGANGEIQLTDALNRQALKGNVIAYEFQGVRFDCGSIPGFVEATNYIYENIFNAG